MRKYLYIFLILCTIFLTGCGTKEVVYDMKDSVDSDTAEGQAMPVESSGGTVAQTLGIEEDKWKEEIGSGADKIYINARLEIPEVTDMYTLEVSEHYYTPEEQQKIAEYFMDEDTIRVNKNKVISKEWLQRRLEYFRARMENYEADEEAYQYSDEAYADYLHNRKVLSNEIDRLTELINAAPGMSDVSEAVKDYSKNYYLGSKGDVEYTLSFNMDEENNTSSWKLETVDGNDFTSKKISETEKEWRGAWLSEQADHENLSALTREQAGEKAEELCGQLGISGMKAVAICDLAIFLERGQDDSTTESEYTVPYELNGYSVVLVRDVNGVAVDGATYCGSERYLDRETTEKPYADEKVIIEFNDNGIISMTYQGCTSVKETGNAVKLLSYEQIQEIFRKELNSVQLDEEGKFEYLYLLYERVINEEVPDEYCYIPVWCLSTRNLHQTFGWGIDASGVFIQDIDVSGMLWLNAIDGSRIDPEKAGFIHYYDVMDNLEFLDE